MLSPEEVRQEGTEKRASSTTLHTELTGSPAAPIFLEALFYSESGFSIKTDLHSMEEIDI